MIRRYLIYGLMVIASICIVFLMIWQVGIKSVVLTRQHGAEMYEVLTNYEKTINSVVSHQHPQVLEAVAAGDTLVYLQKYRCPECATVPVVINVNIENLKVLEYSDHNAKVFARIAIGVVSVNPVTLENKSSCRASATEGVLNMIKEDGEWKISGGDSGQADTWTPIEELHQKNCLEISDKN